MTSCRKQCEAYRGRVVVDWTRDGQSFVFPFSVRADGTAVRAGIEHVWTYTVTDGVWKIEIRRGADVVFRRLGVWPSRGFRPLELRLLNSRGKPGAYKRALRRQIEQDAIARAWEGIDPGLELFTKGIQLAPASDSEQDEIAAECASGNMIRFGRLYELVCGLARKIAARSKGADIDELVQEIFVATMTHIATFDPTKGRFVAWFYRVAQTACWGYGKHRKHDKLFRCEASFYNEDHSEDFSIFDVVAPSPARQEDQVGRARALQRFSAELRTLTARDRQIVKAYMFEGLFIDELAVRFRISRSRVDQIVQRNIAAAIDRMKVAA